jgi:hypothetical protein
MMMPQLRISTRQQSSASKQLALVLESASKTISFTGCEQILALDIVQQQAAASADCDKNGGRAPARKIKVKRFD